MSNLDAILAAAKEQAGNLQTNLPAVGGAPTGLAAAPATGMTYDMSEDAFLNPGGMEVEAYLQVKDAGIKLSKDWTGYIDEFTAVIDLQEVAYFMGIRKEVGSTVSYAKSYNGSSTPRGENFAAVVEEFKRTSQKPTDVYRGADIPMTLVGDYNDPKGKDKGMTDGQVVGLSTSITGFKPWATFAKKLKNAGFGAATIKVKVTHSPRKNAANQEYGVCEFELLEVVDTTGAIAA